MAERVQETQSTIVRDVDGATARRVTTVEEPKVVEPARNSAARAIWYVAGVLLVLLAIRFVLSLLGANRGNPFASLIYAVTYPFVAPFFGLFGYTMRYGVVRFEIETLVAMAVYALIAWGIVKLLDIPRRST